MQTAHQGMGIADADFDALVEDLVAASTVFKVGERRRVSCLACWGPYARTLLSEGNGSGERERERGTGKTCCPATRHEDV